MEAQRTTVAVQRYLEHLAAAEGREPAEQVVRALLERAVNRLHFLCESLLYRSYPRLTKGPLNLGADELLSSVVERLMKAMRQVRPPTVRQFFALANQHIRWELNDLARRLDNQERLVELRESAVSAGKRTEVSREGPKCHRMLEAIESLPEEEREVFCLVRIQGMAQTDAADVIGVSVKTVSRRLNRGLVLLAAALSDLHPTERTGTKMD